MSISAANEMGASVVFAEKWIEAGLGRPLREAVGMTLEDVAYEVDTTSASVSRWERGAVQPRGRNRREYAGLLWKLASSLSAEL